MDLSLPNLQPLLTSLLEAEKAWHNTATQLTTLLHTTATTFSLDLHNAPETEHALTQQITHLTSQLTHTTTPWILGNESQIFIHARIHTLQKTLAALRDMSNTFDWIQADGRAVWRTPTSESLAAYVERVFNAGGASGEGVEGVEVAAMVVGVGRKVEALEEEVRAARDAVAILGLGGLEWEVDEAPLTVILWFVS